MGVFTFMKRITFGNKNIKKREKERQRRDENEDISIDCDRPVQN